MKTPNVVKGTEIGIGEPDRPFTKLYHDGDNVGPLEPWMVEYMRCDSADRFFGIREGKFPQSAGDLIAQAIQEVLEGGV